MVVFSDANDLTDFHNCRTEDWKLPLVSIYVASLYGIVCADFYPAMFWTYVCMWCRWQLELSLPQYRLTR